MRRPLFAAMATALVLVACPAALAGTLSGTFKGAAGKRVVVVQADGRGKAKTVPKNGAVKLSGLTLAGATVQLVSADGTYFGPVVLFGFGSKVYETIKGGASLSLGTVTLKSGYARAGGVKRARADRSATVAVAAVNGKPIGAGRLGRVRVGTGTSMLAGKTGAGRDADLDGIPAVFDVDDDGDLILDNVDRSVRASRASFAPRQGCGPPPLPPCGGGGGGGGATDFKLFSNFKLTGPESINAYLGDADTVNALIAAIFPRTLSLATQVLEAGATLDCLGSSYCAAHSADGQDYPRLNGDAAPTSGTTIALTAGGTGDAQIVPGASAADVRGGDAFLQVTSAGTYPGLLNFAFVTAPAVYSYETAVSGGEVRLAYDSVTGQTAGSGMSPMNAIQVDRDHPTITLKWWRPQRAALPGEESASGWIDIGGLRYVADVPNAISCGPSCTVGTAPGRCAAASYSATRSNGSAFANPAGTEGVRDPAADAPTAPIDPGGHLLEFTIDARTCFGDAAWLDPDAPGSTFDFDIQAVSEYGDNAARKLYFTIVAGP